jgi:hypothetical protein
MRLTLRLLLPLLFLSAASLAQVVNGVSMTGPAPWIDVTAYGAKADSRVVNDGQILAGNLGVLSSTGANFSQADVGKAISAAGAGPGASDLITTITRFTAPNQVTLATSASQAVSSANVRISTDNTAAIQNAINALPVTGGTLYVPYGGTGNYYIASPLSTGSALTISRAGVRMIGQCGEPGNQGNNVIASNCATFVSDVPGVMLAVAASSGTLRSGLYIQDIGFEDVSTNGNQVTGAIHLTATDEFNLTNLRIQRITAGYGIQFDGGSDSTQFGVVINPAIANTKMPVQTKLDTSEINFFGGNVGCETIGGSPTQIAGSIGFDLGSTSGNTGSPSAGKWGVFGTHILDCQTAVSMKDVSVLQWYGVAEITHGTKVGTGFLVDSDPGAGGGSLIGGSISNFGTGVQIQGNVFDTVISASITNNGTGVKLTGSSTRTKILGTVPDTTTPQGNTTALSIDTGILPSTLVTANGNYVLASGGTLGSQIPTDITIPQESTPSVPAVGSRRLYTDSASGHLSSLANSGASIDLEAGLLNYQKATANVNGNGTDKTVYTFTVPPIPAGKGIRARVFWTCVACTTAAKTFRWQFGGVNSSYVSVTQGNSNLSYTEVRIFNDPGSQAAQTLFGDAITVGVGLAAVGIVANLSVSTATSQSLTFVYNGSTGENIAPKGFVVESIQ